MKRLDVRASVQTFRLPETVAMPVAAAVPAVRGVWWLRYGRHAYTFLNFRTRQGVRFGIRHSAVIRPGLSRFKKNAAALSASWLGLLARRYHYDFNLLEEIMMMTVPHTVTPLGNARFLVNLWSWFGYFDIDLPSRSVAYRFLDDCESDKVLGSGQWHDSSSGMLYGMTCSLKDSFARIAKPDMEVACTLFRRKPDASDSETVWQGPLADFMHELVVNRTGRYGVACELGMIRNARNEAVPSRVLIVDLTSGRHWRLDRFNVAAHAQFDPDDPDVVYFSNHNFQFVHSSLFALLKRASYGIRFEGPASVFKYRLTPDGPQEEGVFTRPDFFRLTNMHVFRHRGQKLLAAMGFPDEIFLADADTMEFVRKITIRDPKSVWHPGPSRPALIGTMVPTPDGEALLVHTTRSLQTADLATGRCETVLDHAFLHTCSNHMIAMSDTES